MSDDTRESDPEPELPAWRLSHPLLMATIEELREAITAADAVVREIVAHQPPRQPPILSGDCREDIRLGNAYVAMVAAWEEELDEARSSYRAAVIAEMRAWRAGRRCLHVDEQRSASRDDDAAA